MDDPGLHLGALETAFMFTVAFVAGTVLGAIHFTGLWLTLRHLPNVRYPRALFFGSLLVRLTVVVTGLYLVAGNDWRLLVICLLGFLLARTVLVRYWGTGHTVL